MSFAPKSRPGWTTRIVTALTAALTSFLTAALTAALIAETAQADPAETRDHPTLDYFYIEANEGGSAGGHAAIGIGGHTYHFQYAPSGLLEMARVPTVDFLAEYALLSNRTIHVTRVETDLETHDAIRRAFDRRYWDQRWQLRRLVRLGQGATRLARGDTRLPVAGAGYFRASVFTPSSGASEPGSGAPAVTRLRQRIDARYGPNALADRARLARADAARAAENPGPELSEALFDPLAGLTAIETLARGSGLEERWLVEDPHPSSTLRAADRPVLVAIRNSLEDRLVELFASPRPDWGTPFLVGLARLLALDESLSRSELVFLDSFPEDPAVATPHGESWQTVGPELLAQSQHRFDSARDRVFSKRRFRELEFARMEAAANHLADLRRGTERGQPIRMARGRLVPERAAPGVVLDPAQRKALASSFRRAHDDLLAALEDRDDYHVIDRNCVSALFETIDDALARLAGSDSPEAVRAESIRRLGGQVHPGASLAFIPFVSSRHVREQYRVVETFSVLSDRQARLEQMRRDESGLWVGLRESNVLTSTWYERGRDDSLFLFFTEEHIAVRPLYGAFNLVVGLSASAAGLLWAPFDDGELLVDGLRGTLSSMPELFFVNIRKGSSDFVVAGSEREALLGDDAFPSVRQAVR